MNLLWWSLVWTSSGGGSGPITTNPSIISFAGSYQPTIDLVGQSVESVEISGESIQTIDLEGKYGA